MLLLQTDVLGGNKWNYFKTMLGGNKLNCFKAMQVLAVPTHILIQGFKIAKSPTRYIKGGPGALISRGRPKILGGGTMNPNDAIYNIFTIYQVITLKTQVKNK